MVRGCDLPSWGKEVRTYRIMNTKACTPKGGKKELFYDPLFLIFFAFPFHSRRPNQIEKSRRKCIKEEKREIHHSGLSDQLIGEGKALNCSILSVQTLVLVEGRPTGSTKGFRFGTSTYLD